MTQTEHYNLNKPEAGDPMRLADFNDNANKIDTALANLNTALGSKAEQSAVAAVETALGSKANTSDLSALSQTVSALSTTVGGKGNCKIATGSYVGTGSYESTAPNTLSFDFSPVMVIVFWDLDSVVMARGITRCQHHTTTNASAIIELTWNDKSVSWYNFYQANYQMNSQGIVYHYVAVGY